jgi:phage baseplate assembly protein gpV
MNFPTTSFIRCYKDGVIEINSLDGNSSITVDGTSNKVTVDGTVNVELIASSEVTCTTPLTHVTGNMQIDGFCSHNGCTCDGQGGGVVAGGVEGGQTICGDILPDGELTLRGTTDETKGTVKVDANLACTDNCQLPSICGSDQPDGELDLAGTSDASKGCVNVNSDLKCSSSVYGSDQPDGELVLKGTKDVSKGCVKVDADLACTGGCQLPNVCGSDQVDGELTLSGTSDASKGCVTVDSDLECNGALGTTIKSSIKSYCDGLYSSSSSGVTNGDSHDHSGGDGAQIDHGELSGLSDDDHSIYLKLSGRTGYQKVLGLSQFVPPNFGPSTYGNDFSEKFDSSVNGRGFFFGWNRDAGRGESDFINHHATGTLGGFRFYEYNQNTKDIDLLMDIKGDGDVYILGDLTADSYVDHTPSYDDDALTELKKLTSTKGKIDHKTLPQFARTTKIDSKTGKEIEGRNIGNMVSILTKAVQQLTEKIETLENKITELENP